jgi:uncharacterized protein (TIGR02145 family)
MILKNFRLTLCFILILFLNKIEGQTINNASRLGDGEKVEKKSTFNIEEIKVRWKKAALENCTGVPCVTITTPGPSTGGLPGSPTNVLATAGSSAVRVVFTAPTNTGVSPITSYTVMVSPGSITATGISSPINVTGLTVGTPYTFTVMATNAVGNSAPSAASTAVTPATPFVCGNPIVDINNNSYNTVLIGTQCWTQENLRVRKYNDGKDIRFDKSGTSSGSSSQTWAGVGLNYGAYTLYAHDSIATPSRLSNYGYLYNWYAAAGITADGESSTNNICPYEWHVPSDAEWTQLTTHLGGLTNLANTMKESINLWSPNNGTSTTFNARPGGTRGSDGNFSSQGAVAVFWSSTAFDTNNAHRLLIYGNNANVIDDNWWKDFGNSVRCLKD